MNLKEKHINECVELGRKYDISIQEASTVIFHWNVISSLDDINSGIADIDRNFYESVTPMNPLWHPRQS